MNYHIIDLQKFWGREGEFSKVLDAEERAKADRFKFPVLRRNYILAHAILRLKIAGYLHIEPAAISFLYGPFGKPFLASGEMYFNMSHSRDKALYVFSFDVEVGADIEYVKPDISIDALPLSAFTLTERNQILALPTERQKEAFYQLWTQKEAYLKAIGTGLQNSPVALPPAADWCFFEPLHTTEYISSIAYPNVFLKEPKLKMKAATRIERPLT